MSGKARGLKAVVENLKWWQIGLIAIGVSFLGKLSGGPDEDAKLYTKELKQAPWAPPAVVFGPAWTINNFFLLLGLQRMIKNDQLPEQKRLLAMQGLIWAIFFSFNFVYFRKKSTILAALWTITDAVLAISSFFSSYKVDKKASYTFLPLVGWTSFASTLAVYQALKNDDEALGVKALID